MKKPPTAYELLRSYVDSLRDRLLAKEDWKQRHPDWESIAFAKDETAFYDGNFSHDLKMSSFDPNDLMPHTSDVITAELFAALATVALTAYENAELK